MAIETEVPATIRTEGQRADATLYVAATDTGVIFKPSDTKFIAIEVDWDWACNILRVLAEANAEHIKKQVGEPTDPD